MVVLPKNQEMKQYLICEVLLPEERIDQIMSRNKIRTSNCYGGFHKRMRLGVNTQKIPTERCVLSGLEFAGFEVHTTSDK
jgi:hypothetical protein